MNPKHPSGLEQDLLNDFFVEADEHLLNIRRALQEFETPQSKGGEAKLIADLFHNFHSFKGISAIVGLEPAEALAHATEDMLRLMRSGEFQTTEEGLNTLGMVAQKLEQMVDAFRNQKAVPAYEVLLAEIKSHYPSGSNLKQQPSANDIPTAPVVATPPAGTKVWKFIFSPSPELNARKININTVREQLAQVGQILKSTPVVKGAGIISFEFLIAAQNAPEDIKAWEAKGVTVALSSEQSSEQKLSTEAPAVEDAHNPFLAPSHFVRVDLKRLDDLLRVVGELVIHRSRLDIQLARLQADNQDVELSGVQEVNGMLGRSLRQMREDIMGIRLVPIAEIFSRLPFVLRDLSRQSSKKVRLKLEGQNTAIDKYLIEKLKDPLLHMVRNAFSHGIETESERTALAKVAEATIELSAAAVGDLVIIKVRDDGRGIDANAIIQRAKKLGLEIPEKIDNEALLQILCAPGFSTRDDADRMSGRGVGMAVVQATINELGGKLALESEAGRGTQFTMRLPLAVVIAETLIVSAAGQTCAVPQNSVREIFHAQPGDIKIVDGIEMVSYRGGVLPVTRLAGLFQLKGSDQKLSCVLVITSERGSVGLLVEKVLGQREVVVRPFRDPLIQVAGVAGATELGDGKPVLILDGMTLTAGNVRPADNLDLVQK